MPDDEYVPGGSFRTVIDKGTYEVRVFFNKKHEGNLEDRLKQLMEEEVKKGEF